MKIKNKGFLQIPILLALLLGSAVFGGAGYFVNKHSQNKNIDQPKTATSTYVVKGEEIDLLLIDEIEVTKTSNNAKNESVVSTRQKQETGSDLKIAQCEATKNFTYNKAVTSLNEKITIATKQLYDSLNNQMRQEIDSIYSNTSYSSGGSKYLSGKARLSLTEKASDSYSYLAELTRQRYQTEWYNKKSEFEQIKQQGLTDIKITVEQEYINCLKQ